MKIYLLLVQFSLAIPSAKPQNFAEFEGAPLPPVVGNRPNQATRGELLQKQKDIAIATQKKKEELGKFTRDATAGFDPKEAARRAAFYANGMTPTPTPNRAPAALAAPSRKPGSAKSPKKGRGG